MQPDQYLKKFQKIILAGIIVLGILLRLQNFSLPPIDAHAMRQTDTESVAYNFAFRTSNILLPENSLMRPQTNIKSYFFLEFPLYQYGIGLLYKLFGWHIAVARIYNLALFISSCLLLYYFVKNFINHQVALWSVFFFTFAPGSIFFLGHAIHPDVFAVFTLLLSFSLYIHWKKHTKLISFILSVIALSFSVSTRPFIALVLPAYLYLMLTYKAKWWEYLFMIPGAFVTYGAWLEWQTRFKEADHTWENWVLAGRNETFRPMVLLKQLIYKNIVGEIVGKIVTSIAVIGVFSHFLKRNKTTWFILLWFAAIPFYWYMAPYGNLFHQYYANVYLIPFLLLAANGAVFIVERLKRTMFFANAAIIFITVLSIYNGYHTSSHFFKDIVPDHYLTISKDIEKIIPPDDRLVYLGKLNSVPFSLVHRRGWVVGSGPVDVDLSVDGVLAMKQYGAKYIVAGLKNSDFSDEQLEELKKKTKLVYQSDASWIFEIK